MKQSGMLESQLCLLITQFNWIVMRKDLHSEESRDLVQRFWLLWQSFRFVVILLKSPL